MRILMISDVFFPRVNGVSTSIQTFRRELNNQGHEVTLIVPDYGHDDEENSHLIRIPAHTVLIDPEDRMMKMRHITALVDDLQDREFDIIHIHTPFIAHYAGLKLANALGLPVVETYHTYFEEYLSNYIRWLPQQWLRLLARGFSRRQCNLVDAVVVPSGPMLDILRGYGIQSPMHIVPTGLDISEFRDSDGHYFRKQYGIDQDRPVMVYIGRLAYEKNVLFLFDVLKLIKQNRPNILLILAGEGPATTQLMAASEAKGLKENTLFVGYQQRGSALNDCYAAGDIFIFASRTETQGLVLLEAMALGVPVLSTAVMGTRDVLIEGCGCMIVEENAENFSSVAMWLLDNPGVRCLLGESGRQYVSEWSAPVMATRLHGIYQRAITQKRIASAEAGF